MSDLARGGVGVGVAALGGSAANYLSNVVLGRGLEPAEFGDAALVVSALLVLGAVASGLQLLVARSVAARGGPREVSRHRRTARTAGLVVGGALVAGSPALAALFHTRSAVPFVVLGAGVPVYFLMSVGRGVAQGSRAFGRLAASLALEAASRLVVTLVAVASGLGATGAALALTASFVVAWLPCRGAANDSAGPAVSSATASPASSRVVAAATVLLLTGQVVIANGDLWVVAARLPDDAGLYAAIALIGRLVFIAAWSVVTVVFPSLVSDGSQPIVARNLLRRAFLATAGLGVVLTAGAAAFGRQLMATMVGDGYTGGSDLLGPYALATTLFVLANLVAVASVAVGHLAAPAVVAVGGAGQTVVLALGASRGIAWVVWAQVVVMAAVLVATLVAARIAAAASRWRPIGRPGIRAIPVLRRA